MVAAEVENVFTSPVEGPRNSSRMWTPKYYMTTKKSVSIMARVKGLCSYHDWPGKTFEGTFCRPLVREPNQGGPNTDGCNHLHKLISLSVCRSRSASAGTLVPSRAPMMDDQDLLRMFLRDHSAFRRISIGLRRLSRQGLKSSSKQPVRRNAKRTRINNISHSQRHNDA